MANCVLKDTEYCTTLGRKSCEECDIHKMPPDQQEKIKQDVDLVRSLLPEGGLAPLYESETCLFCRDEPKRKRAWYATTDFGHAEPQGTKASIIGIKIKTKIGSMVPLQISCCSRCKRVHNTADLLTIICMVAALALSLLLFAIEPVSRFLMGISELMSLGVLIAALLIGYIVGKIATSVYRKKQSEHVIFELTDIPLVAKMVDKGWFSIYGDGKIRLIFSKERLKKGWFV